MKIQYKNGIIELKYGQNIVHINDLSQVYLVLDILKCYCNNSDEENFHMCIGILNLFESASREFIQHRELQCIKNLLSIPEFVPNILN